MEGSSRSVVRLIGVYHANGSLTGELAYLFRRNFRGEHCELCDITHGALREKAEWRRCRAALGLPFETVHLDERSPEVAACTEGHTPCVVADFGDAFEILLDRDELARCSGSSIRMVDAIRKVVDRRGHAFADP